MGITFTTFINWPVHCTDEGVERIVYDKDFSKYKLIYADGTEKEFNFNINDYLIELCKLEKNYLKYQKEYVKSVKTMYFKEWRNRIISFLLAIGSVYLVSNADLSSLFNILAYMLIFLGFSFSQVFSQMRLDLIKNAKELLQYSDQLIEEKEKFTAPVENPIDGETIDWPLINISNVQDFSFSEINIISNLPTYSREEIGKEISKKLLKNKS